MNARGTEILDQWLNGEPQGVEALASMLSSGSLTACQRHVLEGYLEGFRLWAVAPVPTPQVEAIAAGATLQSLVERVRHTRGTSSRLLAQQRGLLDEYWDHLSELRGIRVRQLADRDAALRNLDRAKATMARAAS